MGILLRSAVVIGVLVYLSPLRDGLQTKPASVETKPEELPLSGSVGAVWQALPGAAKRAMADEAGRQLLDSAARQLSPACAKAGIQCASPPGEKPKPSGSIEK